MDDYTAASYGDRIAAYYDELYGREPDGTQIDLLAELAGSGPVLELGIGTGRVALPLSRRGVEVEGIDASEEMVRRLRSKPGGADIPVAIGDFASFDLGRRFSLIHVPFNTFFGLLTQEEQVTCFASVASHLIPGGKFLIEAFVPDLSRFDRGQRTSTTSIEIAALALETSMIDLATQRIDSQHVIIRNGELPRIFPVSLRYAWPAELDLMARIAGLALEHRWGGWNREGYDSTSHRHISVWRLVA